MWLPPSIELRRLCRSSGLSLFNQLLGQGVSSIHASVSVRMMENGRQTPQLLAGFDGNQVRSVREYR
jgi:hypothetical protein